MLIPIIIVAAAGAAAYFWLTNPDPKTLPGAGSNVPRPGDDPTRAPYVLPDGRTISTHPAVGYAIYQAVSSQDVAYMRNTARQLRDLGWPSEADELDKIAAQFPKGSSPGATVGARPPTPAIGPELPQQHLEVLQQVVIRQNPAEMRALATKLRAAGFNDAAASLEKAAADVEAANARPVPQPVYTPVQVAPQPAYQTPAALPQYAPLPAQLPTISVPTPTSPPMVVTVPVPPPPALPVPTVGLTPRRAAADALVRHLQVDAPAKRKEDASLVRAYQAAAGRATDGKYGPGDAKSLADAASGRHVPPPPRYWPKVGYQAAKTSYDTWLSQQQQADPARTGEWTVAKAQSGRYYPS